MLELYGFTRFSAIPVGKRTARYLNWNTKNRARLLDDLRGYKVGTIIMDDGENPNVEIAVQMARGPRSPHTGAANSLLVATRDLSVFDKLIQLGTGSFPKWYAQYGCIMLDSSLASVYHRTVGLGSNILDESENDEAGRWYIHQEKMKSLVRDAFVVNYLNPNHVHVLGGIERLRGLAFVKDVIARDAVTCLVLDWSPGEAVGKLNEVIRAFREVVFPSSSRALTT